VLFDYVVVGAGLSGGVMAERISNVLNRNVLVIEKRSHIGGNTYDRYDKNGIFIHQYGPHIFHTKIKEVWDYLSQFTEWREYYHHVLGSIDGKRVPIPFNLNTLEQLLPAHLAGELEKKLVQHFGYGSKVPILKLREVEDPDLKWLADFVYERVFVNYTIKQWGMKPEELDPAVTGRVPVFISRDDRYFSDPYQGLPKHGYTRMFEKLFNSPKIKLMLNTDYREVLHLAWDQRTFSLFGQPFRGTVIYTGAIDELFEYKYGQLPYRSLRFEFETVHQERYQETGTVNYPNEYNFTRITEFKHLTGQHHKDSVIVREYPQPYERDVPGRDIPYYPVPHPDHQELFKKYWREAQNIPQLILVGRLAEYKYYDMDACVAKALKVFEQKLEPYNH